MGRDDRQKLRKVKKEKRKIERAQQENDGSDRSKRLKTAREDAARMKNDKRITKVADMKSQGGSKDLADKKYTNSSAFFGKLQQDIERTIQEGNKSTRVVEKNKSHGHTSSGAFKL